MNPFKTLLVVYDPTREEQPALERAANIAETIQASAHLFACIHYDTAKSADQSGEIQHLITEQQAVLDDAAASLKERGIDVITEVEWDKDWYHAVVRAALRHDADMVLKSSFRHFAGKRTLKKTSDWIVMRECHCPVLLVKIREPRERLPRERGQGGEQPDPELVHRAHQREVCVVRRIGAHPEHRQVAARQRRAAARLERRQPTRTKLRERAADEHQRVQPAARQLHRRADVHA